MPKIIIQGDIIDFPDSAASPDWSPAVIQFALAVQDALTQVVGTFDVPPQIQIIDSYNPGINIDMPNFAFPTTDVRGIEVIYSVFRSTTLETIVEMGSIKAVYNPDSTSGQKWELSRDFVGDAQITFSMTDIGQMRFTTETISGTSHVGRLTYTAKALLQD